jgi:hypothetical protein
MGMKPVVEQELEMVPLGGGFSSEIALEYAETVNRAHKNPKVIYSEHLGEMTKMALVAANLKEIKGQFFAELEWCITNPDPEEEVEVTQEESDNDML